MDIRRYGADAEIISPAELREQMRGMLAAAFGRYGQAGRGRSGHGRDSLIRQADADTDDVDHVSRTMVAATQVPTS